MEIRLEVASVIRVKREAVGHGFTAIIRTHFA